MRSKISLAIILFLLSQWVYADSNVVFRSAFTLKLPVDKEHYYKQEFPKIPYVHNNTVYIFPNEKFRVGITFNEKKIVDIVYDKNKQCKDYLEFEFKPNFLHSDKASMMLNTQNHTPYTITYDAIMVVPDSQKPLKTSTLPILAGKGSYELWPHPIIQLVLENISADTPK